MRHLQALKLRNAVIGLASGGLQGQHLDWPRIACNPVRARPRPPGRARICALRNRGNVAFVLK